jgi:hypothetical protein
MFAIKNGWQQGGGLSPLVFNFALDFAIRKVQVNQDGLKLNVHVSICCMLIMLIYWAEVYILLKKKYKSLGVGSKETRQEVNADETEYTVMSQDQNAEQSHNIKIDDNPLKWWNISNIWQQP